MKLAIVAASLATFLGGSLWPISSAEAAQGDRLSVSRENVNIRTGPSTNAEILMTINAGEVMIEIAEKGEWFFVEFPNLNRQGWIYGPLLDPPGTITEPPQPAAAPAPAAPAAAAETTIPSTAPAPAPTPAPASTVESAELGTQPETISETPTQLTGISRTEEPPAVKTFRETVVELNERAVSVAGINLFTDVRSTGGGGVQVLATETWTSVPEAGQSSYMNALFERWQSMAAGLGPLTLQILDPTGNVVMQRSDS